MFLGVLLDHGKRTQNILKIKLPKQIGILCNAGPYLDQSALLCICYSYIHSYLNHANAVWCSTNGICLKNLLGKQINSIRVIFLKNKFAHTREFFKYNDI